MPVQASAESRYRDVFDNQISRLFRKAVRIALADPQLAWSLWRLLRGQSRALRLRRAEARRGLHVPPVLIASVTRRCNLSCSGCYARAQHRSEAPELSDAEWERILREARDLGVGIVLLAGGEPLVRTDLLDLTARFPEIVFPLFTNGLLLDDALQTKLQRQPQVIPVISLEGREYETDERRGPGVYRQVQAAIAKLRGRHIFWGLSLTATRANHELILQTDFIRNLSQAGCRLFCVVEYVPVQAGTEALLPTDEQRAILRRKMDEFGAAFPGLFIAFPGDDSEFGGCLSGGRGFAHIGPEGNLEPCPFAPYSDANLSRLSLRQALQSEFLRAVREHHDRMTETAGGCALWSQREWVQSLLSRNLEDGSEA